MTDEDLDLIYKALRFFVWAADQGLSPIEGERADEPEEILFRYAIKTGDEDYDGLPDKIMARLKGEGKG